MFDFLDRRFFIVMKNQLDEEPFFRVHYVGNFSDEHGDGYWEKYDRKRKTWTRLCDQCEKRVSPFSKNFCTSHLNVKKRKRSKPKNKTDTNVDLVKKKIFSSKFYRWFSLDWKWNSTIEHRHFRLFSIEQTANRKKNQGTREIFIPAFQL